MKLQSLKYLCIAALSAAFFAGSPANAGLGNDDEGNPPPSCTLVCKPDGETTLVVCEKVGSLEFCYDISIPSEGCKNNRKNEGRLCTDIRNTDIGKDCGTTTIIPLTGDPWLAECAPKEDDTIGIF